MARDEITIFFYKFLEMFSFRVCVCVCVYIYIHVLGTEPTHICPEVKLNVEACHTVEQRHKTKIKTKYLVAEMMCPVVTSERE